MTRPPTVALLAATIVACGVVLAVTQHILLVVGVQVLLVLLVVAVSIPVTRALHDAVPSTIRAGVASGVSTLTWLAFVPFAMLVGSVAEGAGIDRAAWLFVAVGMGTAVLMLAVLPRTRPPPAEATGAEQPELAIEPAAFPSDRFLPPDDPEWPGHWKVLPTAWSALGLPVDGLEALDVARDAIADMPAPLRRVIVLRDVEGRTPDEVRRALDLDPEEQRTMLQQARSLVRARLELHLEGPPRTR
jgi:hypothetical protein